MFERATYIDGEGLHYGRYNFAIWCSRCGILASNLKELDDAQNVAENHLEAVKEDKRKHVLTCEKINA